MKNRYLIGLKRLFARIYKWLKTEAWDFIISPVHPVKRHRILYGWRWGWLLYSVLITITVLWLICLISNWAGITSGDLLGQRCVGKHHLSWAIISQFADPGNLHMSQNKGYVVAFLCATFGVISLSGLLVSSLVSFISRRRDDWQKGLIDYNGPFGKFVFNNYVVIVGVNEQTATIVKASLDKGIKYVLIQSNQKIEKVRMRVNLALDDAEEKHVVFYHGERTSEEDLSKLRLEDAYEVFILGEDMRDVKEQDHDAYNIVCLEHIAKYIKRHPRRKTLWWGRKEIIEERLKCHVMFEYQSTFMAFKFTHIYRTLNEKIDFIPFNVHEIWAKKVLIDNYAILKSGKHSEKIVQEYLPLDAYYVTNEQTGRKRLEHINEDSQITVHLVVVGMNQMGVALAMQTAMLVHLPNYHKDPHHRLCTTITFIDDQAVKEGEFLRGRYEAMFSLCRYRTLVCDKEKPITLDSSWTDPMKEGHYAYMGDNFMDLQWEFIQGNIASPVIRDYISQVADDTANRTTTIAVCFNNPQQAIATALYLPKTVLRKALQILVYQQNSFDMINKVATGEKEWKRYEKLKPFGMMEDCYKGNMFENIQAKLALKLYRDKTLSYSNIDNLIDYLDRLWEEEGIVLKLSNINLVDSFAIKLRSVGLSERCSTEEWISVLKNQEIVNHLAMAEHSRWLTERLTMGYRPLEESEMQFFLSDNNTDLAIKAKKEFYKSKKRAHLDICSYEMLGVVDKTLINDHLIIKNLLKRKFHKVEREILCRIAFRSLTDSRLRTERTSVTWEFIKDMKEISGIKRTSNKIDMWMGVYPVTQSLWERIMHYNPSKNNKGGSYPVENVSMNEIQTFLILLNDITGLQFGLPEKEDWKNAALGGLPPVKSKKKKKYLDQVAWYDKNSKKHSHPVGRKKANNFGLYDMLGNVWEWTQTNHGPSTYYFCGGSWRFGENECDLSDKRAWWSYWIPEFKSADLGFRLILPHTFKKDTSEVNEQWKPEKWKTLKEIVWKMKKIEGGYFFMGGDEKRITIDGIEQRPDWHPKHLLHMSEFYLADAPVIQRHWIAFMGERENRSSNRGYELPVENVSYIKAKAFIRELNNYCKNELGIEFDCFDLPTEAQWEFAARGGGNYPDITAAYSGGDNADEFAWHYGITKCTHPVRCKNANNAGLYDMCGNVWEWCQDWYKADYYNEFTESQCKENNKSYPGKDPTGPSSGFTRILRGGSWRFTAEECRVTRRISWTEDYEADHVGFRLRLTSEGYQQLHEKLKNEIDRLNQKQQKESKAELPLLPSP